MSFSAPVVISGLTFALVLCGMMADSLRPVDSGVLAGYPRLFLLVLVLLSVLVTVVGSTFLGQLVIGIPLALGTGWMLNKSNQASDLQAGRSDCFSGPAYYVYLCLIIVLAVFLRYVNLGDFGLRLDEMYQFRTGIGWLRTGDFLQWDFVNDRPTTHYHRAWISTWVIAQAMNLFGETMYAARLPSVLFGSLLFLPFYGILRRLRFPRWQKLLCLLLLAISPFAISISRWVRMYSFFLLVFLSLVWFVICFLQSKSTAGRTGLFVGIVMVAGFSVHLHLLTLSVVPALAVFLFWEWVREQNWNDVSWFDGRLITTIGLLAVGALAFYAVYGRIEEFVGTAGRIYPMYVVYLFQEFLGYLLGGTILAVSLVLHRRTKSERCLLTVLLVPVALMTVFSARFPQIRYTGFLIPLVIPVFVRSGVRLFKVLWKQRQWYLFLAILGVFMVVPARDLPAKLNYIWDGNMGYVSFARVQSTRYEDVTDWLINQKPLKARVVLCEASGYYVSRLRDHGIDARGVTEKRRLTLGDVRELEASSDSLMWVMPSETLVCMKREALDHVETDYRRLSVPRRFFADVYLRR